MIKETTKKKEQSEKRIMESTKYGESEISVDIKKIYVGYGKMKARDCEKDRMKE